MNQIIPLLLGLFAGIGSGMFGIGGGLIIVPLLVLLMKFSTQQSVAISLTSMLLPVGVLGVYEYWRAGVLTASHLWVVLLIDAGLIIGVFFGAKIALDLPAAMMNRAFAIFLVLAAVRIWMKAG